MLNDFQKEWIASHRMSYFRPTICVMLLLWCLAITYLFFAPYYASYWLFDTWKPIWRSLEWLCVGFKFAEMTVSFLVISANRYYLDSLHSQRLAYILRSHRNTTKRWHNKDAYHWFKKTVPPTFTFPLDILIKTMFVWGLILQLPENYMLIALYVPAAVCCLILDILAYRQRYDFYEFLSPEFVSSMKAES